MIFYSRTVIYKWDILYKIYINEVFKDKIVSLSVDTNLNIYHPLRQLVPIQKETDQRSVINNIIIDVSK